MLSKVKYHGVDNEKLIHVMDGGQWKKHSNKLLSPEVNENWTEQ